MFQNNVRRYVFVLQIDHTLLSMFCTWSVTSRKIVSHEPPYTPWKLLPLKPPSPSEFPMIFCGGGMDIFWNHTIVIHIPRLTFQVLEPCWRGGGVVHCPYSSFQQFTPIATKQNFFNWIVVHSLIFVKQVGQVISIFVICIQLFQLLSHYCCCN